MSRLKPKVKAFGFNKKELKGLAAKIAENLESTEDASDEDVNAEIDEAIEAVLPFLALGQSYANRLVGEAKKNDGENDDNDEEEDGEDATSSKQTGKSTKKSTKAKDDEEPKWFKTYRETMEKKFADLEGTRTTETRKGKLEKLIKDSGLTDKDVFGKQILKGFARMSFENDDDFDEYFSEIEESVKSYNQELADKGLGGTPPGAGNGGKGGAELPELTDAEIDSIIETMG